VRLEETAVDWRSIILHIFSVLLTAERPVFAKRARSRNVIEPPGAIEISPPPKETMHLIFEAENVADLSGRHDAERVIAPAFIDGSACDGERSGDSGVDGDAFLASAALECGGLFRREFNFFHMGQ
jgi:hypothetical protein